MPSFKVKDKGFAGLERSGCHLVVALSEAEARAATSGDPGAYEEVWRNGTTFVGLRIDLTKVSVTRVRELIEMAWSNKAAKPLQDSRS
jgi:hypothetical protein